MSFLDNVSVPHNLQEPRFEFLVDNLFQRLDGVRKDNLGTFRNVTSKKVHIIETFVRSFRTHIGDDIYPSARLIFPNKDNRLYFIRDVVLARLVIKILDIPKKSEDYDRLFNWKRNYHKFKYLEDRSSLSDLPLLVARIVSNRRSGIEEPRRDLKVSEVNKLLDDLRTSSKSQDQANLLKPILLSIPVEQIRWLIKIILKNSILNFFESVFLEKWHPDGVRLFRICNDLEKTFRYLADTSRRVPEEDLVVHPFWKFLPQLSHKLFVSYAKLCSKMKIRFDMDRSFQEEYNSMKLDNKFVIEEKMDGDRMVLHMNNDRFKFFSRRLKDYTLLYGENYHIGSLTKHLRGAFIPGVKSIVLDGEMVAWDFKRNVILPFGTLRSSAIQEAVKDFNTIDQYIEQSSYPLFIVFDIVHFNGKNLTNMPLFYRKNLIKKLINPVPHRLEILDVYYGSSPEDIKSAIKKIVTQRCEGIMVKHVQSKYNINNRSHNWIKIKPEYLEQFGENLDLAVIGKEPGVKNSYMVALKDNEGVFRSFCMVANGFTEYEYDKIERLTENKWKSFKHKLPENIAFGTKTPTFWINPKNSFVLEVKARSIDASYDKTYAVGSSLHNIYCRSLREDKSVDQCITLEEYLQLKERYSTNVEKTQSVNKKRRINSSFNDVDRERISVELVSNLFSRFKFLILTDDITSDGTRIHISDLKTLVKKFGGEVTQTPYINTERQVVIICQSLIPNAMVYFEKGFDLVKPSWIFECIKRNTILQLEPSVLFKSKNLNFFTDDKIDRHGDSWIIHGTKNLPNELYFDTKLGKDEIERCDKEIVHDFAKEDISLPLVFLFKDVGFFLVHNRKYEYITQYLTDKIERFGGFVSHKLEECSYVVVPSIMYHDPSIREQVVASVEAVSTCIAENMKFDETKGINIKVPNIVVEKFIDSSIDNEVLVDASDYKFI